MLRLSLRAFLFYSSILFFVSCISSSTDVSSVPVQMYVIVILFNSFKVKVNRVHSNGNISSLALRECPSSIAFLILTLGPVLHILNLPQCELNLSQESGISILC